METTKTSHFTCQSKSFISIFFTCQISACELQPFSRHNLANDIYLITDKTVFSHLNNWYVTTTTTTLPLANCLERQISWISYIGYWHDLRNCMKNINTEMRNNYEIEHLHICFILSNSSSAWTCYVRLRTRHNSSASAPAFCRFLALTVKLFISILSVSMFNVIFRCTYFCRILLTQTLSSMTKTCKNLTLHHLKVCWLSVFCCWTHRNQTKLFVELTFSNVTILQWYKGRGHIKHLKGNSRGIHFKILKLQLLKVISWSTVHFAVLLQCEVYAATYHFFWKSTFTLTMSRHACLVQTYHFSYKATNQANVNTRLF